MHKTGRGQKEEEKERPSKTIDTNSISTAQKYLSYTNSNMTCWTEISKLLSN